jgi:hypothetical protein
MPPACQGAAAGGDSTGTGRTARPSLNGPGRPLDERHDPGGRGRDCWRRPSLILCQIPIGLWGDNARWRTTSHSLGVAIDMGPPADQGFFSLQQTGGSMPTEGPFDDEGPDSDPFPDPPVEVPGS